MDGGAAGASTNQPGANATVYTPVAQGAADQNFQNIIGNFLGQYNSGTTPGQAYQPQIQNTVGNVTGNPFASLAQDRFPWVAQAGSDLGSTQFNWGLGLGGNSTAGLGYTGAALQNGFTPEYQSISEQTINNPYYNNAQNLGAYPGTLYGLSAAQQAGGPGGTADTLRSSAQQFPQIGRDYATAIQQQGQVLPGWQSVLGQAAGGMFNRADQAANAISPLEGLSDRLVNTGFDPQSGLENRLRQRTLDSSNAVNAMSGIASTPYGAGVTNQNLQDFDLNWQDRQLGRQSQAANAATGVQQGIGGLAGLSGNLLAGLGPMSGAAGGLAGQQAGILGRAFDAQTSGANTGANLANNALTLGSGASALANQAGGLQSNAFMNQMNAELGALGAQNKAGLLGADTLSQLLSGAGSGLTTGSNLSNMGMGTVQNSSLYPYNTFNAMQGNNLSALGQGINMGNQQYALPQQILNDLQSYLQLGQSSSQISGRLGDMGLNQLGNAFQGIGGALGTANSLFGGGGAGAGGAFSAGGLLGSQGPLFGTAADASIASGGPPLALESLAPLALS